jgi:hypothetical protein
MIPSIVMHNPQQGHKALVEVLWPACKGMLMANGSKLVVTAKVEKRTDPQNRHFHAICGNIAKSGMEWAGKPRKAAEWKVLLISGHAVATKEGSEIVPGLEGEFISIRESSALMSKKRGASLIEYSIAFCVNNGIELPLNPADCGPDDYEY